MRIKKIYTSNTIRKFSKLGSCSQRKRSVLRKNFHTPESFRQRFTVKEKRLENFLTDKKGNGIILYFL